ncbi:superoxide dismutase family protein [Amycolatopsis sp. NPDC059657]|uniref:superoxide dismutase family protein n=1 Tax=Amycolatopsis sp. NPDC059657 TaxID=3346899 RepID=UPI00366CEBAC
MRATVVTFAVSAVLVGGVAACSSAESHSQGASTSPGAPAPGQLASATFAAPAAAGTQPAAITYHADLVPAGAKAVVATSVADGKTKVTLEVSGLLSGRMYGAHAHTKACGAKAADAGPHYQDKKDPVQPSVDPAFANASNEIWLDFTTNDKGEAVATTTVPWLFPKGGANSVVLHANHTSTETGKAGTAGDRLACITAAF